MSDRNFAIMLGAIAIGILSLVIFAVVRDGTFPDRNTCEQPGTILVKTRNQWVCAYPPIERK